MVRRLLIAGAGVHRTWQRRVGQRAKGVGGVEKEGKPTEHWVLALDAEVVKTAGFQQHTQRHAQTQAQRSLR
jgi:hypothetical protein